MKGYNMRHRATGKGRTVCGGKYLDIAKYTKLTQLNIPQHTTRYSIPLPSMLFKFSWPLAVLNTQMIRTVRSGSLLENAKVLLIVCQERVRY
ncbi:hypothetical protein VFPPC_17931 [Pochonia chlamydosporia 170]|uniref:Uncharacterized protein n=1 Tax=Pochonia chlamydosporia 170 TaxID=1380566 RepID=A0A219APX8_METCM|nr:hypothetical protein VFPPC_17931 [Pochonia chlamydosporia 170]OWT42876.1 hypothetical protein VFPPC_17931 [Pochonia chlamydosporia 170]